MAQNDTRTDTSEPTTTPESGTGDGWAQTPQGEPPSDATSAGQNRPNPPTQTAPDPGDPGGMGGVRVGSKTPGDRPPGGVSPLENEDREKQES